MLLHFSVNVVSAHCHRPCSYAWVHHSVCFFPILCQERTFYTTIIIMSVIYTCRRLSIMMLFVFCWEESGNCLLDGHSCKLYKPMLTLSTYIICYILYTYIIVVCLNFYRLSFFYFLAVMATLTCALVLAARKQDPRQYNEPVDIFRGICEGLAILLIGYYGISELNQLRVWVTAHVSLSRRTVSWSFKWWKWTPK